MTRGLDRLRAVRLACREAALPELLLRRAEGKAEAEAVGVREEVSEGCCPGLGGVGVALAEGGGWEGVAVHVGVRKGEGEGEGGQLSTLAVLPAGQAAAQGQGWQAAREAAPEALLQVPGGQGVGVLAPLGQMLPGGQGRGWPVEQEKEGGQGVHSSLRRRLLEASPTSTAPLAGSTARAEGRLKLAEAVPVPSRLPAWPLPASVVTSPSMLTALMR
jgi:hypothetical protein